MNWKRMDAWRRSSKLYKNATDLKEIQDAIGDNGRNDKRSNGRI